MTHRVPNYLITLPANAPYKEVIVEEAISRLLEEVESNRDELLEVLQRMQSQRKS